MIYFYLFALVLGAVLLGASMLLGGHHGVETHADAPDGHDATDAGVESILVAFLSLRFWTFFLAFFGLTGVVLDGFGLISSTTVAAVVSIGMGLGAGYGSVWLMRVLRADDSNSAVAAAEYVGRSARVLVAFGPGQVGKIRLEVKGSTIDLLAVGIEDKSFAVKDEVLVVEMDGTRAKIASIDGERASKP